MSKITLIKEKVLTEVRVGMLTVQAGIKKKLNGNRPGKKLFIYVARVQSWVSISSLKQRVVLKKPCPHVFRILLCSCTSGLMDFYSLVTETENNLNFTSKQKLPSDVVPWRNYGRNPFLQTYHDIALHLVNLLKRRHFSMPRYVTERYL
jgi:hypothetical protein